MAERINVLLMGGGGREHAIAERLARSPRLGDLWITHPQNPGLASLGRAADVPVNIRESYRLVQFCDHHRVGLVVIGPEEPLAEGFADKLRAPSRLVFGPGADGARIEADKAWAKQLLRAASIPTAEARTFSEAEAARAYVESRISDDPAVAALLQDASRFRDPQERRGFIRERVRARAELRDAYQRSRPDLPVIKAAGLCKGKGVVVPDTVTGAIDAISRMMDDRIYGDAAREVVIEERLKGPEVSVLALVDGRSIYVLETAQDHKRLGDGDSGPNTGGMGAFSPSPLVDESMMGRIQSQILVPTVDALKRDGIEYRGVLYAGVMLTHAGPKVLEFNCRFGDPECQALLVRLRSDLLETMVATCEGRLADAQLEWEPGASCCVVLASEGYPEKPRTGAPIRGLEEASRVEGVSIYQGATARGQDGALVTAGGRVLGVTAVGRDLDQARQRAYAACEHIQFQGKVYRTDIGRRPAVRSAPEAARRSG